MSALLEEHTCCNWAEVELDSACWEVATIATLTKRHTFRRRERRSERRRLRENIHAMKQKTWSMAPPVTSLMKREAFIRYEWNIYKMNILKAHSLPRREKKTDRQTEGERERMISTKSNQTLISSCFFIWLLSLVVFGDISRNLLHLHSSPTPFSSL